MEPENLHLGGGVAHTTIHPVISVAMVLAILLILTLPRRTAAVPLLLIAFTTPMGQQIYMGGAHWLVLRMVILAGCLRMLLDKFKNEGKLLRGGLNGIDRAFLVYALCVGLAPILLFGTGAVPLQMASVLQTLGGYFFLRYSIRDDGDITRAAKALALLAFVLSLCMATEHFHGINIFGYSGSGPIIPATRNGSIRAQACFSHAILAGCFGATLMPLFYWLWKSRRAKGIAATGMLGSVFMVFFSASSTPVMALLGGIGALFLWPIRGSMRTVRWGIVLTLAGLQLVMKAPVWFVVSRINVTGSSDAWDRAVLIDTFIRHFKDWWIIGANPSGWGWGMWDLSNQFVGVGETGGLLAFICFIALFSRSFGRLGKMRLQMKGDSKHEWLYWSVGAVMFAHILAYFGVAYFDQTSIWWYASLAIASAATATLGETRADARTETDLHPAEVEPELAWFGQEALSAGPREKEVRPEATAWYSLRDHSYFHRGLGLARQVDDH